MLLQQAAERFLKFLIRGFESDLSGNLKTGVPLIPFRLPDFGFLPLELFRNLLLLLFEHGDFFGGFDFAVSHCFAYNDLTCAGHMAPPGRLADFSAKGYCPQCMAHRNSTSTITR